MAADAIQAAAPYEWEQVPPLPRDHFHRFVIMRDHRMYACLNVLRRHVDVDVARTVAQEFCAAISRKESL